MSLTASIGVLVAPNRPKSKSQFQSLRAPARRRNALGASRSCGSVGALLAIMGSRRCWRRRPTLLGCQTSQDPTSETACPEARRRSKLSLDRSLEAPRCNVCVQRSLRGAGNCTAAAGTSLVSERPSLQTAALWTFLSRYVRNAIMRKPAGPCRLATVPPQQCRLRAVLYCFSRG